MIAVNLVLSLGKKVALVLIIHMHDAETIYLVNGEIELTIGDETKIVKAPIKFSYAGNVYHKLVALTDIELVIDRTE